MDFKILRTSGYVERSQLVDTLSVKYYTYVLNAKMLGSNQISLIAPVKFEGVHTIILIVSQPSAMKPISITVYSEDLSEHIQVYDIKNADFSITPKVSLVSDYDRAMRIVE